MIPIWCGFLYQVPTVTAYYQRHIFCTKKQYLTLATLVTSDMDTPKRRNLLLQQATLSNANQTVVEPINWSLILAKTVPKWTPRSVRAYLTTVCEHLNAHFAYIMSGADIGKIEVTRLNRIPGQPPINVRLTHWRMRQLFPQKISLKWTENDKEMKLHMSAFDMWSKSRNRREIQPVALVPDQPPEIAVEWLKEMLSTARTDACAIEFGRSNARRNIYESWHEFVGSPAADDWSPKRISESIYRLLPSTKPRKGYRERLRGVSVMHIPTEEECWDVITNRPNLQLRF